MPIQFSYPTTIIELDLTKTLRMKSSYQEIMNNDVCNNINDNEYGVKTFCYNENKV